jgi:hypothetical protein
MHNNYVSGGFRHSLKFHLSTFSHPQADASIYNQHRYLYHFFVDLSHSGSTTYMPLPIDLVPTMFPGTNGTSAPLACVGMTGRRAVWFERHWERDEVSLMRLSHSTIGSTAGVLIGPSPALPFTPAACHSMAFDEVTGRLCVGLETGELYVLDY